MSYDPFPPLSTIFSNMAHEDYSGISIHQREPYAIGLALPTEAEEPMESSMAYGNGPIQNNEVTTTYRSPPVSKKVLRNQGKTRKGGRKTSKSSSGANSRNRRRAPTSEQRRAANIRERKRMLNLNTAFDELRSHIPVFAYEKHLSRIETLRLAMKYIDFMREVVTSPQDEMLLKYGNAPEEIAKKWSVYF